MNYNSVQDIFNAGITNMTQLTYTYYARAATIDRNIIPNWMTHDNEKMYAISIGVNNYSGNIEYDFDGIRVFLGGVTSSIYYEIGILQNVHNFLKIHWIGKFNNNSTTDDFIYDTIFWDNGNISIHIINIPTTTNEGELRTWHNMNYYSSLTFPLPTTTSPDITFLSLNDGNYKYEIYNGIAQMYPTKWLIGDGTYYTGEDYLYEANQLSLQQFRIRGSNNIPKKDILLARKAINIFNHVARFYDGNSTANLSFDIHQYNRHINFDDFDCINTREVFYNDIYLNDIFNSEKQLYSINITGSNMYFVIRNTQLSFTNFDLVFYNGSWIDIAHDDNYFSKVMSIDTINNLTSESWLAFKDKLLELISSPEKFNFIGYNLNGPGEITNFQMKLLKLDNNN